MSLTPRRVLRGVLRRAVARLPQRLKDRLWVVALRAITASAAAEVTQPVQFALNEVFLRHGVRRYTLRRSGRTLFVRHPVSDAWVVHEVINRGVYAPPPQVQRAIQLSAVAPRIVDLGAHVGAATLMLLERFPTAHVLAVEPNPQSAALLRATFECNALGGQCELRQAAAGVQPGTAVIEGFSLLSHLVRTDTREAVDELPQLRKFQSRGGSATTVEVIDVLPLLDGADLVKMDIEGAEWAILQDPRFAQLGISSLVLEYHPQDAPGEDTTAAVRGILERAGFTVGEPFERHGQVGLVWAWRE